MESDKQRIWVPGDVDVDDDNATTVTLGNSTNNIINDAAVGDTISTTAIGLRNKIKMFGILLILFTLNLINYMDRFTVSGKISIINDDH